MGFWFGFLGGFFLLLFCSVWFGLVCLGFFWFGFSYIFLYIYRHEFTYIFIFFPALLA